MIKPKYWNQCVIAAIVNFTTTGYGFGGGWAAQTLPILSDPETCPLASCDTRLVTFILPAFLIGMTVGPFLLGPLLNLAGRKPCLLLSCAVSGLSWVMMALAPNMQIVLGARLINGVGTGAFIGIVYTYIGEISSVQIRGIILASVMAATNTGVLITYILGAYLEFSTVIYIFIALSCLQFMSLLFVPESPCYYVMKGNKPKAYSIIEWLRQTDDKQEINKEIETIETSLIHTPKSLLKELFTSRINRIPFLIMLALRFFDTFAGGVIVINYVTSILLSSGFTLSAKEATIIIGACNLIPNILTPMLVDRTGRRKILITAYFFYGLFLFCVATFFYLNSRNMVDMARFGFIQVILIVLSSQANGYASPIIGALNSELFQDKIRGVGATTVQTIYCSMVVALSFAYGFAVEVIEIHIIFWIFATNCFVGTVFAYFCVPETMGKTSEDMRLVFEKRREQE